LEVLNNGWIKNNTIKQYNNRTRCQKRLAFKIFTSNWFRCFETNTPWDFRRPLIWVGYSYRNNHRSSTIWNQCGQQIQAPDTSRKHNVSFFYLKTIMCLGRLIAVWIRDDNWGIARYAHAYLKNLSRFSFGPTIIFLCRSKIYLKRSTHYYNGYLSFTVYIYHSTNLKL